MARKQLTALIALATLAAAGTAARADDITIVDESFMSTKTRAEVRAEVRKAIAEGRRYAPSEVDLASTMPARPASTLTRAEVSAEVGEASRRVLVVWYPA